MLEGSSIAAILTGILALIGALATAYMSSWNAQRTQERENKKALAQYSAPLLIAAWDLANWFNDILNEDNYSPERCEAYGNGWSSTFTSYLLGQYFAGVHVLRINTQFLANIRGENARLLKKMLWKIQDEFATMQYADRASIEMRWAENDMLAVQEEMTEAYSAGDEKKENVRVIGWVEFQKKYEEKVPVEQEDKEETVEQEHQEEEEDTSNWSRLKTIFSWYEDEFQRIIFRRFEHLYSTEFKTSRNPQRNPVQIWATLVNSERNKREDRRIIEDEKLRSGNGRVIPDYRVRRLQHLLVDLVELLDEVSTKSHIELGFTRYWYFVESIASSGSYTTAQQHGQPTRVIPSQACTF
ncbi:hypothetical protein LTR64_008700 [Lithohypha guttulata]|uniref:uncharacterized protein n=1 Tax=Lithohypha guttulata TaxID=1690604 RepID=UPI00315CE008